MPKKHANKSIEYPEQWLNLSDAAQFLGVHFTTLRRWADAGQISCIRTPGGRRRFSKNDLQAFINNMRQTDAHSVSLAEYSNAIQYAPQKIHNISSTSGSWLDQLNGDERQHMRNIGQRLMALMMQYTSRKGEVHIFLEEGKRIAGEYGQVCFKTGLPVSDTVRIFLLFQRSILSAIQETERLGEEPVGETHELYARANDFFDELFVTLVENYFQQAHQSSG
jgi:excisionase family DNA binding protein